MAEPKVARDAAELEVDVMLEALGVTAPDASARELLVVAATDGRLGFDPMAETGVYRLARPVALENGQRLMEVSFHEPNGEELQYLNSGLRVEVDAAKKSGFVDLAQTTKTAIRFLTKVGKVPLGVAERVKARDLAVIEAITGFFQ